MTVHIPTYLRRIIAAFNDTDGQSLAEYVMLVMVIAFVVLAAASLFGLSVSHLFSQIVNTAF
jgi:Flp pilus assembly pilin Flp